MLSFFMLARNGVPLQLMPAKGGCELSVHHATGVITERFATFASALRRADDLNRLLTAGRLKARRSATSRRRRLR